MLDKEPSRQSPTTEELLIRQISQKLGSTWLQNGSSSPSELTAFERDFGHHVPQFGVECYICFPLKNTRFYWFNILSCESFQKFTNFHLLGTELTTDNSLYLNRGIYRIFLCQGQNRLSKISFVFDIDVHRTFLCQGKSYPSTIPSVWNRRAHQIFLYIAQSWPSILCGIETSIKFSSMQHRVGHRQFPLFRIEKSIKFSFVKESTTIENSLYLGQRCSSNFLTIYHNEIHLNHVYINIQSERHYFKQCLSQYNLYY